MLNILEDVLVLTVATDDNHGLQRFLRSAKVYGIDVEVLGQDQEWLGGDMNHAGGGQKVNLLKNKLEELAKSEQSKEKIVLFTDRFVEWIINTSYCYNIIILLSRVRSG